SAFLSVWIDQVRPLSSSDDAAVAMPTFLSEVMREFKSVQTAMTELRNWKKREADGVAQAALALGQITSSLTALNTMTQQNAASAEEGAAAAQELTAQAETFRAAVRAMNCL